jgi:hypothetical protein
MSIRNFLNNFFLSTGVVFTIRFITSRLDKDFDFNEWDILLSALLLSVVLTVAVKKKATVKE